MRINYQLKDIVPPMAWIANVKDGVANVLHGKSVCCEKSFFVEGAWNGEFDRGEFVNSNWFCGTGAEMHEDRIVFSTPSHVIYGLFSVKIGGVLRKQQFALVAC